MGNGVIHFLDGRGDLGKLHAFDLPAHIDCAVPAPLRVHVDADDVDLLDLHDVFLFSIVRRMRRERRQRARADVVDTIALIARALGDRSFFPEAFDLGTLRRVRTAEACFVPACRLGFCKILFRDVFRFLTVDIVIVFLRRRRHAEREDRVLVDVVNTHDHDEYEDEDERAIAVNAVRMTLSHGATPFLARFEAGLSRQKT